MSTQPDDSASRSTVVVAEDEFLIRIAAVDAFEDGGFSVAEVSSADQAICHIEEDPHRVLALFTDIHMPGSMDGLTLAHQVHMRWPWIKVILASGKAKPGMADIPPGSHFVQKPYDLHQVVTDVRLLAATKDQA